MEQVPGCGFSSLDCASVSDVIMPRYALRATLGWFSWCVPLNFIQDHHPKDNALDRLRLLGLGWCCWPARDLAVAEIAFRISHRVVA